MRVSLHLLAQGDEVVADASGIDQRGLETPAIDNAFGPR